MKDGEVGVKDGEVGVQDVVGVMGDVTVGTDSVPCVTR